MAEKKKTLKTYKTATGAQQYGDDKAWRKLSKKIIDDFVNLSAEDFKKKYGADAYKMYKKTIAGDYAAKAKSYKEAGIGDRLVKQVEGYEKKWQDKSKKQGQNKGGMTKMKGYAKGGMACGASNPPARPMKK